mmetsp:Transcript_42645/g.76476  ORF Transcript_42645/g.76476 Transcript_42645/m.76476 type:complete len:493 (+) Transcript_42645:131-1609(+)
MPGCEVGIENLCLDDIDGTWFGVGVEVFMLLYCFGATAIVADAHLLVSLETLCYRWGVREDVAGASFMALGSAAPEIIINAISTMKTMLSGTEASADSTDLGIGAIIGSGMIAFTIIPGACGLFAMDTLKLKRRPLARDIGFYSVALVLLCSAFADSVIVLGEAAAMVALYGVYMLVVICSSRVREVYRVQCLGRAPTPRRSFVGEGASGGDAASGVSLQPLEAPHQLAGFSGVVLPGIGCDDAGNSATRSMEEADVRLPTVEVAPMGISPEGRGLRPSQTAGNGPSTQLWNVFTAQFEMRLLRRVLRLTCPECERDSPQAHLYPVTLASSFLWIAFLSIVISAVVSRWGSLLGVPASLLGLCVVAVGAEIPDTIQSVTVARRGYGSMAVSNSTGSQILNILGGLGFPWLLSCMAGHPVLVRGHNQIQVMAYIQAANVAVYLSLVLLTTIPTWRPGDHNKAELGRCKGATLMVVYAAALSVYAGIVLRGRAE